MKRDGKLNDYLPGAPAAPCSHYDAGDCVSCKATGNARNSFSLYVHDAAIALETDDNTYRFPPDVNQSVCDWCVFTAVGLKGCFLELKGSDFNHALEQLASTMRYMKNHFHIIPAMAFAILRGTHPANARPAKANALLKFKREFGFCVRERSFGQPPRPEDILSNDN